MIIIVPSSWAQFHGKEIFLFNELSQRTDARHGPTIDEALIYKNWTYIMSLHRVSPVFNGTDIYFRKPEE